MFQGSQPSGICVRNHPTIKSIPVSLVGYPREFSVGGCEGSNKRTCDGTGFGGPPGVYQEFTYESAPVDLGNFIPHKKGWWFYVGLNARPDVYNYLEIPGWSYYL